MTPELDRLLSVDTGDLAGRPLVELRDLCRQSQQWETAVSLTRRLAQGRLDLLRYETRRRDEGTDAAPTAGDHGTAAGEPGTTAGTATGTDLLYDLPEILAESHGPGAGRVINLDPPGSEADVLAVLLDRVADPVLLSRPTELADDQLTALTEQLDGFEHRLSGVRRQLHDQIDALHGEIGRRYRDGEVSVDAVLGEQGTDG